MQRPRNILVSGCSSGIGYCVAVGLGSKGYRVFAGVRDPADAEVLRRANLEPVQLDLANSESIRMAVEWVLDQTQGRLYALFNNAGFGQPGAVEDLSRQALQEQFDANVFGAHELTTRVLPAMRRQRAGRIIQNSSVLGFIALKYRGAYIASKYALEGLSDTLRLELEGSGIYVSLIEPGPITSRFRENSFRAFRRNIDPVDSVHRETYRRLVQRLQATDDVPFALGPQAVLVKVVHALESHRPRRRYWVTLPTYAFAFLKRSLPAAIMDPLLIHTSNGEYRRVP